MKTASAPLMALLASDQFFMADCYTFTLADSTVARFTTADRDITDAATGHVFVSGSPLFERSKIKFRIGVQVDELDITVTAGAGDLIDDQPWLSALRGGVLDGVEIQLDRAFMATFGDTSAGLLTIFTGRIAEIDAGRTQATIKANTHLELLTQQMPRRLFQAGCAHTLFDSRCALVKTTTAVAALAGTGSTPLLCYIQTLPQANGFFSMGTVTFNSGALAGKSFGIRDHGRVGVGGVLMPMAPLPIVPANGDSVTLYPGCDKQQATCLNKFNNLANFGGFPYVPVPETAA